MWWECSECGDQVERSRAPILCRVCGIAGAIFVPADMNDPLSGESDLDSLRDAWLRAGVERGRPAVASP